MSLELSSNIPNSNKVKDLVNSSLDARKKHTEEKVYRHLWTQSNLLQQYIAESYFKA